MKGLEFSYDSNNPTNGILWYLNNKYKTNYSSFVTTGSTADYSSEYGSQNAVDFNDNKHWTAPTSSNGAYITINVFFPIMLKGYVIQTSNASPGCCHPQHWAFSASNNGVSFDAYETCDAGQEMNDRLAHKYVTFKKGVYRSFRVHNNGLSYCNENRLDLNQLELFGTLYENTPYIDCKSHITNESPHSIMKYSYIFVVLCS